MNRIENAPVASVVAVATVSLLVNHQNLSMSNAVTVAPGTGLPSAHTTRPRTTKVRHHRRQCSQKIGGTITGRSLSTGSVKRRADTATPTVCSSCND